MKRIFIALFVLAAGLALLPAAAQGRPVESKIVDPSPYYPFRLDVVRIYSSAFGYRVVYRKGPSSLGELYLPMAWFQPGGKASLILSADPAYPSITVFYKDGAFSHVRLYAKVDKKDSSWGVLDDPDAATKFGAAGLSLSF